MASTQNLTELPIIQQTGMDYSTVIEQIKNIIESNKNWKSNWTQFYNSDAGTLLIQLMAWICDNLAIRQDLLYNEGFLATASAEESKRRLLNQIGYSLKSTSASVINVAVEFQNVVTSDIQLSNCRENEKNLSEVKNKIFKFYAPDINGKSIPYEILKLDNDGIPEYTYSIKLRQGNAYYTTDYDGNQLTAVQGNTVYLEFSSDTSDGPVFEFRDKNIDLDSVKVYDISENNKLHKRVDNFTDFDVLNGNTVCYVLEQNLSGRYQIRYTSNDLVKYEKKVMDSNQFVPGHTICVFYRTCVGEDANIPANYISVSESISDADGYSHEATILNISSGKNGSNAESLEDAVKNAPLSLTSMNRAVTTTDYDRILKRNSKVSICKTFTPDNMPGEFVQYYGRRINPQEAFSFVVLNKNFNNIPNAKLNYFPWIETIKNNVLNEYYIFGNAVIDKSIYYSKSYKNAYLKDNFLRNENEGINDNGSSYFDGYDINTNKVKSNARKLNNALIVNTGDIFRNEIFAEKRDKKYNLKIKVQSNPTSSLYINKITNILGNEENLKVDNNIHSVETNATYTSTRYLETVDCAKCKYLKFVFDDTITILIDLQKEAQDLSIFGKTVSKNEYEIENIDYYDHYYLLIDNPTPESSDYVYTSQQKEIYGDNTPDYKKVMYAYHNSETYANYRKGIVQLIEEKLRDITDYTTEISRSEELDPDLVSLKTRISEYKGVTNPSIKEICEAMVNGIILDGQLVDPPEYEEVQAINDYTFIYKNKTSGKPYVLQYKTKTETNSLGVETEVVELGKILKVEQNESDSGDPNSNDEDEKIIVEANKTGESNTKQQLMYNSMFANGSSSFIDIGLQVEDPNERHFLYSNYLYSEEELQKAYNFDQKKEYYRIKIGNRIFAIRLDAYSAIAAYNHYKRISLNNLDDNITDINQANICDYYPYFGKGDLRYGLNDSNVIKYIDDIPYEYSYKDGNEIFRTDINAEMAIRYESGFSREIIAHNGNDSGINPRNNVLNFWSEAQPGSTDTDKIASVEFNLNGLALTLEYIFSPLNMNNDIIYEYINGKWYDLKKVTESSNEWSEISSYYDNDLNKFRTVLDGNLRVRKIKKANYDTNATLDIANKSTNITQSGYEYDLRFEYLNAFNKELKIGSVADKEIMVNENLITIDNIEVKDFINEILGKKRQYSAKTSDYANNIQNVIEVANSEESRKISLKSQKVGEQSSIYFIQTCDNGDNELIYKLGLLNAFPYKYQFAKEEKGYVNRYRSDKAYGIRRIELFIGDDENRFSYPISEGASNIDINKLHNQSLRNNEQTLEVGNIICTSSDINYSDFESLYISYTFDNENKLRISKQDNFYYSSNKEINEMNKPPISGIEGQSVYLEDETYYIDPNKSDFGVKITKNKVDTNSYYAIKEDTYNELNIIKNDITKIETNIITGYDIENNDRYNSATRGIKIKAEGSEDVNGYTIGEILQAAKLRIPMIMSFDEMTSNCPPSGVAFSYDGNRNNVLAINPGRTYNTNGADIYQELLFRAKQHEDPYINKNYFGMFKKYYNTNDKLIITGLDKSNEGNITFYFPDQTAFNGGVGDLNITNDIDYNERIYTLGIRLFYRMIFGTNITNKEFYDLYPREEMERMNGSEVVVSLNPDNDEEYFYCPDKNRPLKFVYRAFVDGNKTESKYGDYFITAEARGKGFDDGYDFFIEKTDNSSVPDIGFYLHFINDRTFEKGRQTEEDALIEYMKRYQIIGTELNILKPYFKTFDISGKINYNANYDVATVKANVNKKLKEKYSLNSVNDIVIGNNIYRSDIYKLLLGVNGVESVELNYFGYDITKKDIYPDQKYSLNVTSNGEDTGGAEFYITSILADTDGIHGITFSYTKNDVTTN